MRRSDRDGDGLADGADVAAEALNAPSSVEFYKVDSLCVGEMTRLLQGVFHASG